MKKSVTTTIIVAVLVLIIIVVIASCNRNTPQQNEKIVIGTSRVALLSAFWIAENKGFFKEEGLNVEVREFESGRGALQEMLTSEAINMCAASQTPVVYNSFGRNDYAIIGGTVQSYNDDKVLVRLDRGIREPADLKGKTIGITGKSAGHFFLGLFLAYHRLQISDIKIIDMEAPFLPQALADGQVDAIATWEPFIQKAMKSMGNKVLVLPSGGMYRKDFYFVARKDFIEKKPDAVRRFLRAIKKGINYLQNNRDEAIFIVGKRLNIDREVVDATWDELRFTLYLDQSIVISLEDEARWAIRNNITNAKKVPNYLDYIHSDALKAVDARAVKMAGK